MSDDAMLRIDDSLALPRVELEYQASRSGGPGGQHVNTSSTRIEVAWDVAGSPSLSEAQRARILERLASRIDSRGVLRIAESGSRSQHRNREEATSRLAELVAGALVVPKSRKRTRSPRRAKEARLRGKKQRAETKRLRKPPSSE